MPALASFLLGIVASLVGRVLVALGFSVVTIVGFDAAIGKVKDLVYNSTYALPADAMQLFFLAGGGVALNIIFGAITFRLSLWSITKSVQLVGKGS